MAEISDEDLFECGALVYSAWAREFDALKRVKAEVDDGSEDWAEFHKARLDTHSKAEAKWRALKDRIVAKLPRHVL